MAFLVAEESACLGGCDGSAGLAGPGVLGADTGWGGGRSPALAALPCGRGGRCPGVCGRCRWSWARRAFPPPWHAWQPTGQGLRGRS